MKNVVFRVDSSTKIGSGHLMRCLTLANKLKSQAYITFVCRDLENNSSYLVVENGYKLLLLPRVKSTEKLIGYEEWLMVKQEFDADQIKEIVEKDVVDCLIIDHYALDERWENIIRPYVKKIMVIDDLADRKHNCDILLDQNYQSEINDKYYYLVPAHCNLYLGLEYVLLRDQFYEEKKNLRKRDGIIRNILIFFGGSDDTNETIKTLQALSKIDIKNISVNVIVGDGNCFKGEVKLFCEAFPNMHYYCQVDNMAEFINKADLIFGASGSNTWERCFLGTPSIVVYTEKNQKKIAESVDNDGAVYNLGFHEKISWRDYLDAYKKMDWKNLIKMQEAALNLVIGNGVKRLIENLMEK